MKGTGRSIRENAELSVWGHIWEAAAYLAEVGNWPLRRISEDIVKGLGAILALLSFATLLVCAPVTVPLAGICRKVKAVRRYRRELELYTAKTRQSDFTRRSAGSRGVGDGGMAICSGGVCRVIRNVPVHEQGDEERS